MAGTIVAKTPMNTLLSPVRSLLPAWLAFGVVLGFSGCHAVDFYDASLQAPVPPAMEPPRELSMVSLPSYRVEPPDILQIEMLKLVPLPPYRIDIYDVLQIRVLGTMLDQPIDGFFLVEGEGIVTLGPAYGRVRVAGMTVEEASEAITRKLQEVLNKPDVSVQLARTAGTQPVTGQYLIAPDGTINLRQYGLLKVAGKTVTEIRKDLTKQLSQYFDSPEVTVDVIAYNSKVFYVITQGAGLGDNVRRVPITGNETVLDALSWSTVCRRYPARRCGLRGRRRAVSAASRFCRWITRRSPRAGRRPRTTRSCPATGCLSPRTTWSRSTTT